MNLTGLIDVAIGLTLIYLGTALFVTIINEYVAQKLQLRGKRLAADLITLIDSSRLQTALQKSPALKPFFDSSGKPGSYADPNVVGRLLVGSLRTAPKDIATMAELVKAIDALPPSNVKDQLSALAQSTEDNVEKFVDSVSDWADRSLTMMGEVFKQRMQLISFCIGLGIAVAFNIDTLTVMAHLYQNKEAREAAAAVAEEFTARAPTSVFKKCMALTPEVREETPECAPIAGLVDAVLGRNEALGKLPLGWNNAPLAQERGSGATVLFWLSRAVGWVLTALAVSLGAPFWFDLLNRLISVRHGMRRPEVKSTA